MGVISIVNGDLRVDEYDEWGLYRTSSWDYKPTYTSLGGTTWWEKLVGVLPAAAPSDVGGF